MPSTFAAGRRVKSAIKISRLGPVVFLIGILIGVRPGLAVEMDELMDNVMQGMRQETRQSIQQQVQQETREVIQEEKVIPSNTRSGLYIGTGGEGGSVACEFIVSGSTISGQCRDHEGSIFILKGTVNGDAVTFSVKETFTADGNCPAGTETTSASGIFKGNGAPGTTLVFTVGPTCGDNNSTTVTLAKR